MYKNENDKTVNRLNGIESVEIINETTKIPEGLAIVGDKVRIASTEDKTVIAHLENKCGVVVDKIRDYEVMRVRLENGEEYSLSQDNLIPIRGFTENNQSAKADAGKLRLTLVPRKIIFEIAKIREYGCKKYKEPDNWKRVEVERYRDAAYRHFMAYLDEPNGVDKESGLPHLSHLACNIAFLCELEDIKE